MAAETPVETGHKPSGSVIELPLNGLHSATIGLTLLVECSTPLEYQLKLTENILKPSVTGIKNREYNRMLGYLLSSLPIMEARLTSLSDPVPCGLHPASQLADVAALETETNGLMVAMNDLREYGADLVSDRFCSLWSLWTLYVG